MTDGSIFTVAVHAGERAGRPDFLYRLRRSPTPCSRWPICLGDGLVRLSVGIEDPADILADLERALTEV